jgi:hypothetical protein
LQTAGTDLTLGSGANVQNFALPPIPGALPQVVSITNLTGGMVDIRGQTTNVAIPGSGAFGGPIVRLQSTNPDMSGVSKFVVTNGATLHMTGAGIVGVGPNAAGFPMVPTIDVQIGGTLGDQGNSTGVAVSTPASAFGTIAAGNAATINLLGASRVNVRNDNGVNVGGIFSVQSVSPVVFDANRHQNPGTTGTVSVDQINFAVNNARPSWSPAATAARWAQSPRSTAGRTTSRSAQPAPARPLQRMARSSTPACSTARAPSPRATPAT